MNKVVLWVAVGLIVVGGLVISLRRIKFNIY